MIRRLILEVAIIKIWMRREFSPYSPDFINLQWLAPNPIEGRIDLVTFLLVKVKPVMIQPIEYLTVIIFRRILKFYDGFIMWS